MTPFLSRHSFLTGSNARVTPRLLMGIVASFMMSTSLPSTGLLAHAEESSPQRPFVLFQDNDRSMAEVADTFKAGPVSGYIHAANTETHTFVFTYNDPNDTAKTRNVAIIPLSEKLYNEMNALHRFDRVSITGELLNRPIPQPHVLVHQLKVLERWSETPTSAASDSTAHQEPTASAPDDKPVDIESILNESDSPTLLGKVHAIVGQGHVLMFDYKGTVIPVMVQDTTLTRTLWRGDKVKLALSMLPSPQEPHHLMLNPANGQVPVELVQAVKSLHEPPLTITGPLVYYPPSPLHTQAAWAIQHTDEFGLQWSFVLKAHNDTDQAKLDETVEQLWKAHKDTALESHHKWINPQVVLRVKGIGEETMPSQWNPVLKVDSIVDTATAP